METIQAKHNEYEVVTLTRAMVYISHELKDVLMDDLDYTFDNYGSTDVFSSYRFQEILDNKEDYEGYNLSEDDYKDIEDIIDLLKKVDFINVSVAL